MRFDYTAILFTIPVAVVFARLLRKFLNTAQLAPRWDKLLDKIWVPGVVILGLAAVFQLQSKLLDETYLLFVYLTFIALLLQLRSYKPARTLLLALVPFALYSFFELLLNVVASGFIKEYDDTFDSWQGFSVIWMVTFAFIARNQKRSLETDLLLREKEEQEKLRIATQNTELERMVSERTAALTQQAEALQSALTELRTTQAQLIQAEKMASLGELTAGIAHEIQNPLNFVNNFAEVSVELCQELREEVEKVELAEADKDYLLEILNDLSHNQLKINQHGQRASSIVRGMLQHSRASTGERQATDLNSLADEYLRLAYHGLRAKDKTFNATLNTTFDEAVKEVGVLPQDLGRVLLNLFNNAFYAVQQRQKNGEPGYQPTVTVSTKQLPQKVEIRVRDNGTGIPEEVRQKIFQPFFTTKPTGEGTGLGLSLSYDIVTKGHGGTLAVESQEGKGTEFIISLPA
ncbi:ATP-binding protein [Hymenobacter sp. GOD-10R]|uniref:ATP-binding protein n=1 Tax=Hymenobacter sp. GOD-10R TaxID=3093922 RepID=UPI002D79153C|nr:ATP-binding protein [Hymenobacter sp. GOD-10R]WRQ29002.1 ATP-binding protein [Hymenobacter sp. GOD-10R]